MRNTPHLRWSRRRRLFRRFYVLLGQRTDAVSAIRRNPRGDAGEEQAGLVPYSRIRYVTIQVLGCYLFFDFPRVADNFQPKRTELQRITSERDRRFHTSPTQGSLGLSPPDVQYWMLSFHSHQADLHSPVACQYKTSPHRAKIIERSQIRPLQLHLSPTNFENVER